MWASRLLSAGGLAHPERGWDTPAWSSPFFSSFFMSRSFSTLWGSLSHSCIRTKGSLPFKLSLCQGLGLDNRSDTEPCVSPRMLSPNNRCPGDRAEGNCHPRPSRDPLSGESEEWARKVGPGLCLHKRLGRVRTGQEHRNCSLFIPRGASQQTPSRYPVLLYPAPQHPRLP